MFIVKYSKFGYGSFFLSPHDKIGWTNQLDLAAKFELNKARKLLVLIYYKLNIYISSHDTINILYVRNK